MPLAWLALNSVKGLGPVRIKALLEHYGSPEEVFKESPAVLAGYDGMGGSLTLLNQPALFGEARRQLDTVEKLGARVLTLADDDYPLLLREIFAPPPVLFVRGNIEVFRKHAVGIVGTRQPTEYGKGAAAFLTKDLARQGIVIVSGLARGIDTVAHETALAAGGTTVAVFGCGIDRVYPAANRALAQRILEQGAAVSEFPPGTPPESYNFPRRNRIISGLSAGVVVVESGQKGGALITGHYALQQGREVFAVPGSIFSDKSAGTHNLIKSGATPVRSAADIIDAITVMTNRTIVRSPSPAIPLLSQELLNDDERQVFQHLGDDPVRVDILGGRCGKEIAELLGILLNLEIKGMVKQLAGQQYVKAFA